MNKSKIERTRVREIRVRAGEWGGWKVTITWVTSLMLTRCVGRVAAAGVLHGLYINMVCTTRVRDSGFQPWQRSFQAGTLTVAVRPLQSHEAAQANKKKTKKKKKKAKEKEKKSRRTQPTLGIVPSDRCWGSACQ